MPELWTDDEGRKHEVIEVNPLLPLAIITVLSTVLAILVIYACLH